MDLNQDLTTEQRAVTKAFQRLTEENLYWSVSQRQFEGSAGYLSLNICVDIFLNIGIAHFLQLRSHSTNIILIPRGGGGILIPIKVDTK